MAIIETGLFWRSFFALSLSHFLASLTRLCVDFFSVPSSSNTHLILCVCPASQVLIWAGCLFYACVLHSASAYNLPVFLIFFCVLYTYFNIHNKNCFFSLYFILIHLSGFRFHSLLFCSSLPSV